MGSFLRHSIHCFQFSASAKFSACAHRRQLAEAMATSHGLMNINKEISGMSGQLESIKHYDRVASLAQSVTKIFIGRAPLRQRTALPNTTYLDLWGKASSGRCKGRDVEWEART